MNDKKGISVSLIAVAIFIVIFLVIEWNPLHAFDSIKSTMNYFIFFGLFIGIQAGIIFGYWKLGKYVSLAFNWYNHKLKKITYRIHSKIEQSQFK